jgi:small GTP-binding protein
MRAPLQKVVFLGDSGVGKTSIYNILQKHPFKASIPNTVGGSSGSIEVCPPGYPPARLILWDTAGQEKYRGIVPLYCFGTAYVVVVYDITSRISFTNVPSWIAFGREHAPESAKLVLLGNKNDDEERRVVTQDEGWALAEQVEAMAFFETSAKSGTGIDDCIETIAKDSVVRHTEEIVKEAAATVPMIEKRKEEEDCC